MREVDPTGVAIRRRRRIQRRIYYSHGPNHMWHVDGYDKLKPYGFPIHGCIDGFSRKIMWLSVGPSNNDPAIVAKHFVECVQQLEGCPEILQSDSGTENGVMGALQNVYLDIRIPIVFPEKTVIMSLDRFLIRHCIRYCFMSVLQRELDLLVERWNTHHISRNRTAVIPNGRPIILHTLPEEQGFKECLRPVSTEDIDFAHSQCKLASKSGSFEFDERAMNVFLQKGWDIAYTWQESLKQYFAIVRMNL